MKLPKIIDMYRNDIDTLKGIAIVAVVLFHLGILRSGYLGVDIFFVISGFLIVPSVVKKILGGEFSYWKFMGRRITRLLPLVVLASVSCLVIGYHYMLPDAFENLGESVVASNLFSENILSSITTKNYWDVVNDYNPLMHLWYVGILMEFYVVLPLFLMLVCATAQRFGQDAERWIYRALMVAAVISLLLFLGPTSISGDKFYLLPSRFFELAFGGLIALSIRKADSKIGGYLTNIQLVAILALLGILLGGPLCGDIPSTHIIGARAETISTGLPIKKPLLLFLTVALTCVFIGTKGLIHGRALSWIGKMSYSIFVWHQVLLAFYRYTVSSEITIPFLLVFSIVVLGVSALTYYFIEQRRWTFMFCALAAVIVVLPAIGVYLRAGVVRDVPELEIKKGEVHRGMFAEYCDRVYALNKDFKANGKPNVLVVGVSFGRDFANVLLESSYRDSLNISYGYKWDSEGIRDRAANADFIFSFSHRDEIPESVWNSHVEIYGIGTKNYGASNGQVYAKRHCPEYHSLTSVPEKGYWALNQELRQDWGDHYIDLMSLTSKDGTSVRVFTPSGLFISQDCRHLTPAGAKWYAQVIDWEKIFEK